MPAVSAGLLLFRREPLEFLLGHPGGPYWQSKDLGVWTLPKGLVEPGEELLDAARREFAEETGLTPTGPFLPLGSIRQSGGKTVHGWAFEGDCDPADLRSNTFEMEWPPRSGRLASFPELDRFEFFEDTEARRRLRAAQIPLLDALVASLEPRN